MSTGESEVHYYVKLIRETVENEFPGILSGPIKEQFDDALDEWESENQKPDDGLLSKRMEYEAACTKYSERTPTPDDITDVIERISLLDGGFDASIPLSKMDGDDSELMGELLDQWGEILEAMSAVMQNASLERSSADFISKMRGWLDIVSAIGSKDWSDSWGLSSAKFTYGHEWNIKRYAEMFRNNRNVQELTDMLGRLDSDRASTSGIIESFEEYVDSDRIRQEMSGVTIGREIEGLLPSELSLLMDDDLSVIFDLRFAEGTLMSFAKEGKLKAVESEGGDVESPEKLGPIILVTDRSGSMGGQPSNLQKGLCFTIITRAAKQNRPVFRIDFNTDANCIEMDPKHHMEELMRYLGSDACGGTDPRNAMIEALDMTERERYRMADILVMTDYYLDESVFYRRNSAIENIRKRGCRIHLLCIRSESMYSDNFDSCWGFNRMYPNTFRKVEKNMWRNGGRKKHRRV